MKIAVISDVHANFVALQRVMEQIDIISADAIWCLGDVAGYGPHPHACIDLIRERTDVCLAGNHDLAILGRIPIENFNPIAQQAILWHRQHIDAQNKEWLQSLQPRAEVDGFTLAHASPRHPVWEYVNDEEVAIENYHAFNTPICLIGHSHHALAWQLHSQAGQVQAKLHLGKPDKSLFLTREDKWMLNPGSVGQPRDRDPRASFAILDTKTNTWTWHRVAYDARQVEKDIRAAGLPEVLGERLYWGK